MPQPPASESIRGHRATYLILDDDVVNIPNTITYETSRNAFNSILNSNNFTIITPTGPVSPEQCIADYFRYCTGSFIQPEESYESKLAKFKNSTIRFSEL